MSPLRVLAARVDLDDAEVYHTPSHPWDWSVIKLARRLPCRPIDPMGGASEASVSGN